MIVDKIQQYLDGAGGEINPSILEEISLLAAASFQRQFGAKRDSSPSLRLSSIGKCVRQQAYSVLGFPKNGKEIDARAKMVFFQGDLAELAIVELMKVAGLQVSDAQMDLELDGVPGHPDGIFTNEAGSWLLEVKSMSSFSFADFQRGNVDSSYLYQINAYLYALKLQSAVMVGLNKDAGVLHEQVIKRDEEIIRDIKERIQILKTATKETLPQRPYGPDAKGFYPWQCLYCAYRGICQPQAELVLDKNKYRLKERKLVAA